MALANVRTMICTESFHSDEWWTVCVRSGRRLEQAGLGRRYDEFDVADRLRQRGWVVPAYTMAPGAEVNAERKPSPRSAAFPDIPYADLPDAKCYLRPQCTASRLM